MRPLSVWDGRFPKRAPGAQRSKPNNGILLELWRKALSVVDGQGLKSRSDKNDRHSLEVGNAADGGTLCVASRLRTSLPKCFFDAGVRSVLFAKALQFHEVGDIATAGVGRCHKKVDVAGMTAGDFDFALHAITAGEEKCGLNERLKITFAQVQVRMQAAFLRKTMADHIEKRSRVTERQCWKGLAEAGGVKVISVGFEH